MIELGPPPPAPRALIRTDALRNNTKRTRAPASGVCTRRANQTPNKYHEGKILGGFPPPWGRESRTSRGVHTSPGAALSRVWRGVTLPSDGPSARRRNQREAQGLEGTVDGGAPWARLSVTQVCLILLGSAQKAVLAEEGTLVRRAPARAPNAHACLAAAGTITGAASPSKRTHDRQTKKRKRRGAEAGEGARRAVLTWRGPARHRTRAKAAARGR